MPHTPQFLIALDKLAPRLLHRLFIRTNWGGAWKLALLLAASLQQLATAAPTLVWQIGKFDQSPVEFATGHIGAVNFQVGSAKESEDWPSKQSSGEPFHISFNLSSPSGAYTLRVAALIEQPRVPTFEVSINGHAGLFFLHPKLSYSRSDFTYAFDPHEASSTIEIRLPREFMKAGRNELTLTCVDQPATPEGEKEIGGIAYDAVSLTQDIQPSPHKGPLLAAEPTIFFHQGASGLTEVVDAFVRFDEPWPAGELDLEVAGRHYKQAFEKGEFGERRISVDVAEWTGTARGILSVALGEFAAHVQPVSLTAQRKWTVFVVPHSHLDVGFTDYQGKVAETQARVLGQAEQLIGEHSDFRFSMDGSWNLQQFLETRPVARREEMLKLIRSGKLAMPAQYLNLLTGYASLETLYRSLYYSKRLSNEFHLPYEYANITDVPTYSGSYPSVLASAGVKYWVAAANNDRAPIFFYNHWNEKSPFWWQGPDGNKVLFWYSRHYQQVEALFGSKPQLEAVRESLPIYLQAYPEATYKPDVAMLYGTQVENTDLIPATATFATDWNAKYAYPALRYATFPDFFHYLNDHYASDLPTFRGDGGGYWEDGVGSDAYFAAQDRRNQNRALSAEILASATHSVDSNLNPPENAFHDIWRNIMLFAEHTWLSHNAVSQPTHEESVRQLKVKDDRAEHGALEIEDVANRSLSQLADLIHIPAETLVVFNSLNWRTDQLVETDLDEGSELVDLTTQQSVPYQVLQHKEQFQHVRFLAKELPGVGYKCFRIQRGTIKTDSPSTRTSDRDLENAFYRLKLDPESGSITSIFDKEAGKELVDPGSPYKFGQYLYVTGGDGNTQMINPFPALKPGVLSIHAAGKGRLIGIEKTSWGTSIRMESSALNTPLVKTEILLINSEKRVEFRFEISKTYTTNKEAVYFAFPAAISNPQFSYASQQGWVDPRHGLMKGGSVEWFNVQQWMAVHNAGLSVAVVPVDASLATFGDINRGQWPGEFNPKSATLFSYVMNNYWHTNYRAGQGGSFAFRYVVTSSPTFDGNALSKLGLSAMRPAEQNYVIGQDKVGNPLRPLPPEGTSLLETREKNVALVTWKQAENGNGSILRLAELAGKPTDEVIRFTRFAVASASLCSGVEDDQKPLSVNDGAIHVTLKPFEVVTIRASGKPMMSQLSSSR